VDRRDVARSRRSAMFQIGRTYAAIEHFAVLFTSRWNTVIPLRGSEREFTLHHARIRNLTSAPPAHDNLGSSARFWIDAT
jgi:hypothetical protein